MIHYICLFVFLFEVSLLLRRELEAPALFFVPPLYAYFGSCRKGISEIHSPPMPHFGLKIQLDHWAANKGIPHLSSTSGFEGVGYKYPL